MSDPAQPDLTIEKYLDGKFNKLFELLNPLANAKKAVGAATDATADFLRGLIPVHLL